MNQSFIKLKNKFDKIFMTFLDKKISQAKKNFFNYKEIIYFYELIKKYSYDGKRLRPLFMISAYKNFKKDDKIFLPAVSIELLHTYSLILDDIMDEDEFRRNKPTIYKKLKDYYLKNFSETLYEGSLFNKKSNRFSVSFAIMIANITNILSKEAIIESDFSDEIKIKALENINKIDREIYNGQMLDLLFENKNIFEISEKDYYYLIKLKTAILFGLSLELAAIFLEKQNLSKVFRNAGINWALGFQIRDDLLDLKENEKGREIGSDLKKQKKTLIFIKAINILKEKSESEKINFLLSLNQNSSKEDISKAIKILKQTKSIEYAEKKVICFEKKAKKIFLDLGLNNFN
ncbi:MAG: polyprenyl synthetase family protein [Candidatus Woesearchaeota archaeon]